MKIVCPSCDYVGEAVELPKGSRKKEIILWCCLLVPGMLYTMWRQSRDGRYLGCPRCREGGVQALKRKEWKDLERSGKVSK